MFATGRIETRLQRALVVLGYLLTAPAVGLLVVLAALSGGCWDCPRNLVVISASSGSAAVLLQTSQGWPVVITLLAVTALLTTLFAVVLVRWWRAGGAQRRAMGPAVVGAVVILAPSSSSGSACSRGWRPRPPRCWPGRRRSCWWSGRRRCSSACCAAASTGRGQQHDRRAGPGLPPDRLEQVLARTLHDPSAAASVAVDEQVRDGVRVVSVVDDGVGGADPDGAGLRGLADRVAAAGGRLRADRPAAGGTRLTAKLPCA